VAQRQPDRDQPLLRAVVDVPLEPTPLLVAGGDDPRPRLLDLGQPAPHLHPQAADLDRKAGGLDHAVEQVGSLGERRVVNHRGEMERAAIHRCASAVGIRQPIHRPA
jgi:hypothetical protein